MEISSQKWKNKSVTVCKTNLDLLQWTGTNICTFIYKKSLNNMQLLRNQLVLVGFVVIYVSITENITRYVKETRARNDLFSYSSETLQSLKMTIARK